jgi:hypothetical protein
MNKALVVEESLRCYRLSWWGLIPVFGLLSALLALSAYRRANEAAGDKWNPARGHAVAGVLIAFFGMFVSTAITGTVMVVFMRSLMF